MYHYVYRFEDVIFARIEGDGAAEHYEGIWFDRPESLFGGLLNYVVEGI